eukprot:2442430-Rhodomonas_salina.5
MRGAVLRGGMVGPGEGGGARGSAGRLRYLPTRLLRDVRYSHSIGCYARACYAMPGTDLA